MEFINITKDNIKTEHICCAIGNDIANKKRSETKKQFLIPLLEKGLVFRKLNERGKVFIEYMPAENSFKAVNADNYMLIHCLWVSGKFKGQGYSKELMQYCIKDSQEKGKDGICVVTSGKKRPFLTDKSFYEKFNFKVCDTGKPFFELMYLPLKSNAEIPQFTENAKEGKFENSADFTLMYTDQCTFTGEYSAVMKDIIEKRNFSAEIIKLSSADEAKTLGGGFTTFGLYYKGNLITNELMTDKKLNVLIDFLTK